MTPAAFLKKFHPDRTWLLTAIEANQKGIETKAFPVSDTQSADAAKWIKKWNGKRNLYFSVAEVIRIEDKKADRENVAAVHFFHVDIDAQPGKDLNAELKRIKALVTTKRPESVPKPTCVIFSGGGYQAFWRLAEPLPIQGDPEAYQMAAAYNKQLELLFGGDSCHSVDHIMRLPGTQNIPSPRKVQRGRVQVEAKLESFTSEVHKKDLFAYAADVDMGADAAIGVEISGNIARLATVDDLDQWGVPDRVKVIVVNGFDPDTPKDGDNSRSAWLFDCVCQLVRADVPDDTIYSVITDPDFKVAESVLEASNPDRYAKKQIKSAKEAVESEWLHKFNSKFAVIGNMGGTCRVIEEVLDEALNRYRLTKQDFTNFRNRYNNIFEIVLNAKNEPRQIPVGKWWLEHPRRRYFDRIVFAPGKEIEETYNLWRGYGCNAIPGAGHESFLAHLHDEVCDNDDNHYSYLLHWLARTVQTPAQPGHTAIVMRGRPGTGKSFFAYHFGKLFGRHYLSVTNAKHLTGQFNSHLRDAIVVFGDEAFSVGNREHESTLKTLITETALMVEAKGIDAELGPNYVHLILASNADWVVPIGAGDRRYFVVDVSEKYMQDREHFGKIVHDLEHGGYEALLYYLLNLDISGFNVEKIPMSMARQTQLHSTLSAHDSWWYHCLEEARVGGEAWSNLQLSVFNDLIWEDYLTFCQQLVKRPMSPTQLGMFLGRLLPGDFPKKSRARRDGELKMRRVFPAISIARAEWSRIMRVEIDWCEDTNLLDDDKDLPF